MISQRQPAAPMPAYHPDFRPIASPAKAPSPRDPTQLASCAPSASANEAPATRSVRLPLRRSNPEMPCACSRPAPLGFSCMAGGQLGGGLALCVQNKHYGPLEPGHGVKKYHNSTAHDDPLLAELGMKAWKECIIPPWPRLSDAMGNLPRPSTPASPYFYLFRLADSGGKPLFSAAFRKITPFTHSNTALLVRTVSVLW